MLQARVLLLLLATPALAVAAECWDGTGQPFEAPPSAPIALPSLTKGYPPRLRTLDRNELARRQALVDARLPGVHFELNPFGLLAKVVTRRLSCATWDTLQREPHETSGVPADGPIVLALEQAVADVAPGVELRITGTLRAADGAWQLVLEDDGQGPYERLARDLPGRALSDAALLQRASALARFQRIRTSHGDSCGPECGPPTSTTFVLGSRAIRASDVTVERYVGVYREKGGLTFRKVAALSMNEAETRLSNGLKLLDAVTGERIDREPEAFFSPRAETP